MSASSAARDDSDGAGLGRSRGNSAVRVGPVGAQLAALDAIADLDRLVQLEDRIFDVSSEGELLPTT